jgi:hypothetical protein
MAEQDGVYVFEVRGRLLRSDRRASAINEYHRALAQAAVEAILDGVEGYIVQGVQRGGVGFVRVQVPAQVAEDGRWLLRRDVV